jgi:hypothetical protein
VRYSLVKVLLTVPPFRALLPPTTQTVFARSQTPNPLSIYSCKLFVAATKANRFAIKHIQILCAKHPGWGIPARSPRLKSATYKLLGSVPVCKQVTPPPAPQHARFSRVAALCSLSPLSAALTPNRPLTPLSTAFAKIDGALGHLIAHSWWPAFRWRSIFYPFVFTDLQIPLPAIPFFSHSCKSPGVWVPLRDLSVLCVSVLCVSALSFSVVFWALFFRPIHPGEVS